jgi:hypothetical protein
MGKFPRPRLDICSLIGFQGLKYSKEAIEMIKDKAALKHETDLDDCADMYISIAENTSMTGQRIAVGEWHTSSIHA